jgi:hypothetical protein
MILKTVLEIVQEGAENNGCFIEYNQSTICLDLEENA